MSIVSRRRAMIAVITIVALSIFPVITLANHSWGGYHWARTANPFNLKLGDNVSGAWDPVLVTTSSDWSQSIVLNTNIVAGLANPKNCRATSGRVEVCNSKYGNNGWLGIAQIWANGLHITQGTVRLNDTYFSTPTYNTTAWRNLVSCQEVGHALGLDHQDATFDNPNLNTCMDYTNNPASNQHPNSHDYDELVTIYSHLDSSTTVGSKVPPAMNDIDFDSPGQWGRVVKGSRESGHTVHELDFGNGNKVFTFVFWTRPGRD